MEDTAKICIDLLALLTILGVVVQYLPAVASLFAIIWYGTQIYTFFFGKK